MTRPASAQGAWPGNSSRVPSHPSIRKSPYGSVGALRPGAKGKLDDLLFQAAAQLDEETLCTHLDQIYQHNPHLRRKFSPGGKRPKSAGQVGGGSVLKKETVQSLQERIGVLEKQCGVQSPNRTKSPRAGGPNSHRRLRPKSAGDCVVQMKEGDDGVAELKEPEPQPKSPEMPAAASFPNLENELRESKLAEARLREAQECERKARELQARERARAEDAFRQERLKCESLELARQEALAKLEAGEKERERLSAHKEKYWKDREAEVMAKLRAREEEVERLNAQLLSYSGSPRPPSAVRNVPPLDPQTSAGQLPQPDWASAEKQVRGVVARINEVAERDRKARAQEKRWNEEKAVLLEKISAQKREYDEITERCTSTEQLLHKEKADQEAQAEKLSREIELVFEDFGDVRMQFCNHKAHVAEVIAKKRVEYTVDLDNLRADLQGQATHTAEVSAWLCERDSVLRNLDDLKQRATDLEQKQWLLRETAARLEEDGRTLDMEANAEWEDLTNGCLADSDRIRAEIDRWEQQTKFLEERQHQLILTLAEMEANFGSMSNSRPSSAGASRPTSLPGTRPTSASMSRGAGMRPSSAGIPMATPIPEATGEGMAGMDPEIAAELTAWTRHAYALEERQRGLVAALNEAQEQLDLVDKEEEQREAEREELYMQLNELRQFVAQCENAANEAPPAETSES